MTFQLPEPPNILGFPESDMPFVKYFENNKMQSAKWTGRYTENNTIEVLLGYSFLGFGLSKRIPLSSVVEV